MKDYEKQFNENLNGIKGSYIAVYTLADTLLKSIYEFYGKDGFADAEKFLIANRSLHLATAEIGNIRIEVKPTESHKYEEIK